MKAKQKRRFFSLPGHMDYTIFFVVMFLISFGIIMVYSSSFNLLLDRQGNMIPITRQVWIRQLIYGVIGLTLMVAVSRIDIRFMTNLLAWLYPVTIVLLLYLIFVGRTFRGAARAIELDFFSFQPSELAKLAIIVLLAICIEYMQEYLDHVKILIFFMCLLVPVVLGVVAEDLSTGLVIVVIGGAMILVSYRKLGQTLLLGGISGAAVVGIALYGNENRVSRLDLFASGPWANADGHGRQTVQSLLAIGSGGFFGRGLGQSLQKMGRVTQAHHDIIFAIICEELGLFGAMLIIFLYLGLCYQFLRTIGETTSIREALIVTGVMFQIISQVMLNVGVASNFLPNTGMPLPFISYGGSSLIVLSIEIGLVLAISKNNQYNYVKRIEAYQLQQQLKERKLKGI